MIAMYVTSHTWHFTTVSSSSQPSSQIWQDAHRHTARTKTTKQNKSKQTYTIKNYVHIGWCEYFILTLK